MPIPPGTRLGPYEIRSPLGSGGMSEVYRAHDKRLRRDVALKVLVHFPFRDEVRRQRFAQEAYAASGLNHPNIVSVFDVNLESRPPYIISEIVEGETLRESMDAGPMPVRKLLEIAVQIADGLAAAHQAGIVHRDLKPQNILLTHEGRAKIADFGLAKQLREPTGPVDNPEDRETTELFSTSEGIVVGTVAYMSPEQARGKPVDTRSDIFSFGLLLYEMAAGKRPFDRGSIVETLAAIIQNEAPPLPASVPLPVVWLIDRCLAKEASQRYESTRDLYQDLRQQRDHLSQLGAPSAGADVRPERSRRRWPWIGGLAVGALLLGLILAVLLLSPGDTNLRASQFQPLVTGPDWDERPAWSPDGKSIAYTSYVNGTAQIMTKSLDAAAPLQVTHCTEDCGEPAWSADGRRIFYEGGDPAPSVWSVGAAGGAPQKVAEDMEIFGVSRDGKTLAFARRSTSPRRFSIWLSSPPGAAPVRYAPAPFEETRSGIAGGGSLAFAPDGKRLLWHARSSDPGRGYEFWLLPLPVGSGTPRRVLETLAGAYSVRGVSWMPDNRRVVLASTLAPDVVRSHLYEADVERGVIRPLMAGIGMEGYPDVSRDGKKLAYTALEHDANIVEIPLNGLPVRDLLATNRIEHSPCWSPRGRELAYVTDRRGVDEIWLKDTERGWDRPLVMAGSFPEENLKFLTSPAFSPEGDRIAFVRYAKDGAQIWIAAIAGGAPIRLTSADAPGVQVTPTWSPDGNWIAFFNLGQQTGLMKARVGGNEPPVLLNATTFRCFDCVPDWSPKGDWIAYNTEAGTALISPDGRNSRLVRKPALGATGWSRDGSILYGLAQRELLGGRTLQTGNQRLVAIDVGSGKEKTISEIDARVEIRPMWFPGLHLSLSPDGQALATTAVRRSGDIWMLEDFDRPPSLLERLGLRRN